MKTLTIFTPAYNRGYIINQCFESLCRQTCKDFIWLVVDDGSTDNTAGLIKHGNSKKMALKLNIFIKTAVCILPIMLLMKILILS